ncbi:tetratricopeptide repeat protein [Methyloraptor flagellatus]|jgi:tetratricopeptide (TPR) repeat protein|uniref:Tetratricopeptide repeat protein 38 n=1 Tax=Methyloraptor flagellatus TaxID=3162530 RepID=A0AAU7XCT3_9HYPH
MSHDIFGLDSSVEDANARAAFEEAVHGVGAHGPNVGAALGRSLAADPLNVPALALRGFANLILAREELEPPAAAACVEAERALGLRDGGTRDERILVRALRAAVDGSFRRAIDILDNGFIDRPAVFLPFKLAHALRFMAGDGAGMLRASERMLSGWDEANPAAGFLLGCHAFALEEHGQYEAAEHYGRRAVALQPDDSWGLHAVAHVFEMRGETRQGIEWLEAGRRHWSRCNNFSFHMAWHIALMRLECGEHDRVLDLYDAEVRPRQTDDFRDMANAVSLLWRLDRSGVDVGERWSDLAEIARRRRTDSTLIFAMLHTLVALVALEDADGVLDLIATLEAKAASMGDQAEVARAVGLPVARIIAGLGNRGGTEALDRLALDLPRIGGSNAQRDLFMLHLAEIASRQGDERARASIHMTRHRLKAEDHLIAAVDRRARAGRSAGVNF